MKKILCDVFEFEESIQFNCITDVAHCMVKLGEENSAFEILSELVYGYKKRDMVFTSFLFLPVF